MEKFREEIVFMNEAPTRPLHLHKSVRPILSEDGELDFVGVEETIEEFDIELEEVPIEEPKSLPSPTPIFTIAPRNEAPQQKVIRGVAPSCIRLDILPSVREEIELVLTRCIGEYRRLWWATEDRQDAERIIRERQRREFENLEQEKREKEEQSDWNFLYSTNPEDFEI